MNTTQIYSSN